jgi:glycine oxidase
MTRAQAVVTSFASGSLRAPLARRLPDAIVVGGGVIGAAIAWSLARAGLAVTLLERGELAGQASSAAAGMLAPISESHGEGPLLRAGLASLARFPALVAELRDASGIDPEWVASGCLRVPADDAEAEAFARRARSDAALGLAWLEASEVARLAPGLAGGHHARGALFCAREAHVRSPLLTRAFAAAAAAQGAHIETGVAARGLRRDGARVCGVATSAGERPAGLVVLCPGSFAAECAAWIGPEARIPVEPVRGQIVALEETGARRGVEAPAPRCIVWGRDVYLVPKLDGSLVVGATVERVGFDARTTAGGVERLLAAARALLPETAGARFLSASAGFRPDTPDHLPLVGPWPGAPGLVIATGHYRNGVLLAPLTGQLVADGVLGKGWAEPAFDPARFAA